MTITLTPEMESFVERKVKSGGYTSAAEVVCESLRLLDEQDRLMEMRKADLRFELQKGIDDLKAGRFITVETQEDPQKLIERIKTNGRKKLQERKKQRTNGSI